MPILTPTDITGRIVWLGVVRDRSAGLTSAAVQRVTAGFEGFEGEAHGGLTRPACVRMKLQYPRGAEIRNSRQITIVSAEELAAIAAAMGLERIAPEWLGASMMVEGIPAFTTVPPSARLISQAGTGLVVDMENAPCRYPAEEIERHHPGQGLSFPRHARNRRGVTAWIEHPGPLALGDRLRLHIPPQRLYAPATRTGTATPRRRSPQNEGTRP